MFCAVKICKCDVWFEDILPKLQGWASKPSLSWWLEYLSVYGKGKAVGKCLAAMIIARVKAGFFRHFVTLPHLLGLAGPEGVSQQLDCSRGIHKPAGGAHHEGEQAAQLLHEGDVPLVLRTESYTSPLSFVRRHEIIWSVSSVLLTAFHSQSGSCTSPGLAQTDGSWEPASWTRAGGTATAVQTRRRGRRRTFFFGKWLKSELHHWWIDTNDTEDISNDRGCHSARTLFDSTK